MYENRPFETVVSSRRLEKTQSLDEVRRISIEEDEVAKHKQTIREEAARRRQLNEEKRRARAKDSDQQVRPGQSVGRDAIAVVPNATLVRTFYGTDRLQTPGLADEPTYGVGRSPSGKINYGVCSISIPNTHKIGKLETPSIVRLEFRPDPKKHIVIHHIESMEENLFLQLVRESVLGSVSKEAFIFIHGYKVSFEDAARRTGQIAFDLHFVGAPIFYSWPSNGKLDAYLKDETNITWSTPHFARFLGLISQHCGAERIHIFAHSMGNRAVCDALKAISHDVNSNVKFNHLVLAAADIDADTFRELAVTLQHLSAHVTLYESSNDRALKVSKLIHGNPRAGEPVLIVAGMDTIDASAIDTDFLGHSYFSDNWPLLSDIYSLISKDMPPAERFGLSEASCPDGKYYAFRP
jgi:esterase/lipase superfamily enzyme